jgi:toxin ParE1/3/4
VGTLRFSRRAEADLLSIDAHTLRIWGEHQRLLYMDHLEECCKMLAENPALARACDDVRRGLRRMECGRHVVFFRKDVKGILVWRILHQSMLPGRQAIDDDDHSQ